MILNKKLSLQQFFVVVALGFGLSACTVTQLPADQPMSLLVQGQSSPQSHDNAMTRSVMMGLLGLDGTQKELFNGLLDTLGRQQKQMAPSISQFQAKVRQSFASKSFNAQALQQQWTQMASQQERKMAAETAFQMVNLWDSLKSNQRQQAEKQLNRLQSAWNDSAAKSLKDMQQKQTRRMQGIKAKLSLNASQQGALQAMVIDPKAVLAWQQGIRNEINALIRQLRGPGSNVRVLQTHLEPIYGNARYLSVQLKKLETLHAKLSPAQRQQLLLVMK
ncbi:MAG: hypothetical protein CVV27_04130 [Candidatus Melainabacteria bacterium HGW-Melainabacteria-1]|nr:MAG: hypothetical protein CVV27_04130 [Candidatus Melainabacteria bacterium HGW-Melainabacteria-1]